MDTKKLVHCVKLGGGRAVKEDKVDPSVGFIFHKKIGEKVKIGESSYSPSTTTKLKKILFKLSNKNLPIKI